MQRFSPYLLFLAVSMVLLTSFSMKSFKPLAILKKGTLNDSIHYSAETHFKNVKQLTFADDNAEAYFSFDGKSITFQSNNKTWTQGCDQIFTMPIKGFNAKTKMPQMISTSEGRTTCSYFMPDGEHILFASTHLANKACPAVAPRTKGGPYLWNVYDTYDIFIADLKGNIVKQLTNSPGYDAEATVSPKGDKIVFTSTRSGDLELWTMNLDGTDQKQVTSGLGYDGGAFFSPDGKKLVFRASRPRSPAEVKEYKDFLADGLVAPTKMEIFTCNVDGSDLKQVTNLGGANWAPFFHPSGNKIIFSSNFAGTHGFQFNLYMINLDGTKIEKISADKTFDAFPMFSPDGKKIIFSSNRNNHGTRDTNLFIADWVE
jgi:Tol biopolymer transport system component